MIVVCIEGPHGSGKTSLCEELKRYNKDVLDEAFFESISYELPQRSILKQMLWLHDWIERILKKKKEGVQVLFADRSPESIIYYCGGDMQPMIERYVAQVYRELDTFSNITFCKVCLEVPPDEVWNRVRQPETADVSEARRRSIADSMNWYQGRQWDVTMNNNSTVNSLAERLLSTISPRLQNR